MMGRNIRLKGVIWKIISKLSLLPQLIWSTDYVFTDLTNALAVYGMHSLGPRCENTISVQILFVPWTTSKTNKAGNHGV